MSPSAANFADRLVAGIRRTGTPCIVGLDPRIDEMPAYVLEAAQQGARTSDDVIYAAISEYHTTVIDAVADLVPAVKPQAAFFEQYGVGGLRALQHTVRYARGRGLQVILDAKRGDIPSTAEAYSNAILGRTGLAGSLLAVLDVDCVTVSPYLGLDSLQPFLADCETYGKGVFILVKTSNPGSDDFQNLELAGGALLYQAVAERVAEMALRCRGECGYSSVGAVVGATFPHEAAQLRTVMPASIFLVPGLGAQGGAASDVGVCFDAEGLGAVVSASRSVTYGLPAEVRSAVEAAAVVRQRTQHMIAQVGDVLRGVAHA